MIANFFIFIEYFYLKVIIYIFYTIN